MQRVSTTIAKYEKALAGESKRIPEWLHGSMVDMYDYYTENAGRLVPGENELYRQLGRAMVGWFSYLAQFYGEVTEEQAAQRRDLARLLTGRYHALRALGAGRNDAENAEFARLETAYRRRLGDLMGHYIGELDAAEYRSVGAALGLQVEVKRVDLLHVVYKSDYAMPGPVARPGVGVGL